MVAASPATLHALDSMRYRLRCGFATIAWAIIAFSKMCQDERRRRTPVAGNVGNAGSLEKAQTHSNGHGFGVKFINALTLTWSFHLMRTRMHRCEKCNAFSAKRGGVEEEEVQSGRLVKKLLSDRVRVHVFEQRLRLCCGHRHPHVPRVLRDQNRSHRKSSELGTHLTKICSSAMASIRRATTEGSASRPQALPENPKRGPSDRSSDLGLGGHKTWLAHQLTSMGNRRRPRGDLIQRRQFPVHVEIA